MSTTLRPTRQAQRLHLSHLATTHRAPLVPRDADPRSARPHTFTAMAREPLGTDMPRRVAAPSEA
ncbi:hypothetical protein GCM10009740_04160 [Terrabacter terrae]|uniref:Uncharacterized protein n=1 Tax=Terrabacter terrae TaxID=318434 RepID=A0ABN2TRZ7_9MICO